MKISELIETLEGLYFRHDDVEVFYTNTCCCYGDHDEDPEPEFRNGYVFL